MTINRSKLLEEIKLRKAIQCGIKKSLQNRKNNENLLRTYIRKRISEAIAIGGSPTAPYDITAINFLKDLLKKIVPSVEEDYKELTTSKDQRVSFRKHILNAVDNLVITLDADPESVDPAEQLKEDVDINFGDGETPGFIDIYDDDKPDEEEVELSPEEEFGLGIDDEELDKTGRNAAYTSFQQIKNQIENEYSKLDPDSKVESMENKSEREVFKDFLLLNLKLYFDRFEEELSPNPPTEPETPSEYSTPGEEKELENVPGIEDLPEI
jgi:hypothetical protein